MNRVEFMRLLVQFRSWLVYRLKLQEEVQVPRQTNEEYEIQYKRLFDTILEVQKKHEPKGCRVNGKYVSITSLHKDQPDSVRLEIKDNLTIVYRKSVITLIVLNNWMKKFIIQELERKDTSKGEFINRGILHQIENAPLSEMDPLTEKTIKKIIKDLQ